MKRLFVLCLVLLAAAAPRALGRGGSVRVLSVPGDFATIQAAVNDATAGDIINVAPGTYCERVTIPFDHSGIRLRSAGAIGEAAVLNGSLCGSGGFGIRVSGASDVEISGFTIEGYESGVVLENATESVIHLNEIRNNSYAGSPTPSYGRAQGIVLAGSSFNDITQNWVHDNGHLGIGLFNGSNGNLIRGNRLTDNQAQQPTYPNFACSLMLWGTANSGNRIVENEITGSLGYGLMIGSGPQTANLVAQNRIHGHPLPGIVVMPGSTANAIEQNNALGNGDPDLRDYNSPSTNVWLRNLGTCTPGNAGCE